MQGNGQGQFFLYYSCCFAAVHVAQMHRYCTDDGGRFAVLQSNIFVFNSSIHYMCLIKDNLINCRSKRSFYKEGYAEEDDGDANAAIF